MKTFLPLAAAAALLSTFPARAHEVACERTAGLLALGEDGTPLLGEDGLPIFSAAPAPILEVSAYPAVVGVRDTVTNLAPETSVIASTRDTLLDGRGALARFGDALGAGLAVPLGAARAGVTAIPVADRAACLALAYVVEAIPAAAAAAPACRADAVEGRLVFLHERGSAECRVRILCGEAPPAPPPPNPL